VKRYFKILYNIKATRNPLSCGWHTPKRKENPEQQRFGSKNDNSIFSKSYAMKPYDVLKYNYVVV